jgi:hypothetical protein
MLNIYPVVIEFISSLRCCSLRSSGVTAILGGSCAGLLAASL